MKEVNKYLLCILMPIVILILILMSSYYIILFGEEIILKAAPVDPRDVFRGDYIELKYEIENIRENQLKDIEIINDDEIIYGFAVLKPSNGYYKLDFITRDKPKKGIFLKCHVSKNNKFNNRKFEFKADYNIDRFYVKENTGQDIEDVSKMGDLLCKIKVYNGNSILMELYKNE